MGDQRRATIPQLARFLRRCEKAHEALDSASWYLLQALRAYDGDKISVLHDDAMAWEDAKRVEAAIDALTALVSSAESDAARALKALKQSRTPEPSHD